MLNSPGRAWPFQGLPPFPSHPIYWPPGTFPPTGPGGGVPPVPPGTVPTAVWPWLVYVVVTEAPEPPTEAAPK